MSTVYNNSEYTTQLYAKKATEVIKKHDPHKVNNRVRLQSGAVMTQSNITCYFT